MTSFTFAAGASRRPGPGFSEITWPFFTVLECKCEILPTAQSCDLIARSAVLRVLPLTFGTTHLAAGEMLRRKFASTEVTAPTVTVQALVPEHAPDQPSNVEPASATAVRVTVVSLSKLCEQADPHWIPVGELVTVPAPLPDFATERV
jgi:hypothetical protein